MKIILQLAESGSFLGQVDLFKVRGKFALTDAYEDHFLLPKGKILVVTHRRVILLQVSYLTILVLWRFVNHLKSTLTRLISITFSNPQILLARESSAQQGIHVQ